MFTFNNFVIKSFATRMWLICFSHKTSLTFHQVMITLIALSNVSWSLLVNICWHLTTNYDCYLRYWWWCLCCGSWPSSCHIRRCTGRSWSPRLSMNTLHLKPRFPSKIGLVNPQLKNQILQSLIFKSSIAGFYLSIDSSQQVLDVDLEKLNSICRSPDNSSIMSVSNQTYCLGVKTQLAEAINFSNNTISMCTEEFPPLNRSFLWNSNVFMKSQMFQLLFIFNLLRFLYSLFTMVFQVRSV